ncbi:MAG: bifunctional glutamate N-acetyltransferase/amino-acid acetyltransferase ArgJ, partial [Candidatus Omnitrophica bacterium]|nr:bifunctional glutamate N-acetyltransferase/amino-acid acetyltransferase ArgJ [Candidatus Omnitrophota bacterium]
ASCVLYTQSVMQQGQARAIIANSGNANCLTGAVGAKHTRMMAEAAARQLGIPASEVSVASTGMIGHELPIRDILSSVPALADGLKSTAEGSDAAAHAILTTDRVKKETAVRLSIGGKEVRIGAISKGAGMIHPEMTLTGTPHATMLCFVTTDAKISRQALDQALERSAWRSFAMITIDGDQSTNDMVLVMANGAAGNKEILPGTPEARRFGRALRGVCQRMAKSMVRDAEGATKFVEISVQQARSEKDARSVAMCVATSKLVKTALFGSDPNWGRIAASIGMARAEVDPARIQIKLGPYCVLKGNRGVRQKPSDLARIFHKNQIRIRIDLGIGRAGATVWTGDLSTESETRRWSRRAQRRWCH